MFGKRIMNFFMVFSLVFALMIGGFQVPVNAAGETKNETVTVIGDETSGILVPETVYTFQEKTTALTVLENSIGANNLEVSESNFGKMITGIKGLRAKGNFYWAFYINGVSAQVGADQYIVQKGDTLSFQYVDWSVTPEKSASIKVTGNKGLLKEVANIAFVNEPTAFQLLQAIYGDKLVYSESEYGKMITSIDGLAGEGTNYWAFYVNGQMGSVGADSYKLRVGDQISFQYESWEKPGEDSTEEPKEETKDENSTSPNEAIPAEKLQKAIDSVSQYVLKNEVGDWEVIALKQAGKEIPVSYLEIVAQLVKDKNGKFSRITDYERYTLGILAAGGNPSNIAGYNLVEKIYNGEITKQGLNGVLYALIAVDSADFEIPETAKWSREKLVSYLLDKQNKDGGWSWDGSDTSDIDTSAMVLTSLAPYQNQADVKAKMDKAVQYLSSRYMNNKVDNSSTASQVVIALSSVGIDANGVLFTKEGTSLIDYLLTFQNADGGFDWQGGTVSDVMSSGQGIQGIVSYQLFVNGKGSLYQLPITVSDNQTNVQEINNGQEGKPLPNTATNQYNILAFGLLLMLIGAVFFIMEKRKKA